MKKQIFILVFVLFAIGMTKSYGQLLPRTITCLTSDALHPIAGQAYTYAIDVPALPGSAKTYNWLVTQDQNFIVAGGLTSAIEATTGSLIYATGTGYNAPGTTATPGAGAATLSLTWKSMTYDPTAPIFVVIQVKNLSLAAAGGCETSNLKVFKILPINAFTLDIANLLGSSTTTTPEQAGALADATFGTNIFKCIHDIVTATYDPTPAAEGVIYDYGIDYLFFEVVAANFNKSWKPTFTLTGVDANENVTVEWATTKAFTIPYALTKTGTVWSSADVYTVAANGSVGPTGASIYVRITLDHSLTTNYQGLASQPVVLAVDGLTNLDAAVPADYIGDVHHANGQLSAGPPVVCNPLVVDGYDNDIAYQTLNPRPTITSTTVGVAPNPNPGNFLPVKL